MSSLNTQSLDNVGSKILPQNQVDSNGMTISFSNLSVYNTDAAQAYSLQGVQKLASIQSQSSSSGILTTSGEIIQLFTISNNFNSVHKINSVGIQFTVTNNTSSPVGFTSALSAIRYIELLQGGSTIVTIDSINTLCELLYLSHDQLVPIAEAMGLNYNPDTKSFTEGFVLPPYGSRVLTYPVFCPVINKVFLPCLNTQFNFRVHWAPFNQFVQPKISTALSSSNTSPNLALGNFSTTAYTTSQNLFSVDNFQLMVMGLQFYGETYNRLYNDHINKSTFSKILVPRASIIPLSSVLASSSPQQTQQLSVLSGSFIDLNMWVNASNPNSNTSFTAGSTASGYYMDNYNYVNTDLFPTQLYAAYNNVSTGSSGTFPTYLIPNKKAGMGLDTTSLLDSSGQPVLGVLSVQAEYQSDVNGLINRAPLLSILPIVNFSFDDWLNFRFLEQSFLTYIKANGLFNIYYTPGANYFYTGVSGAINQNLNCSLYISAHQCALAGLTENGALTIIYI